MSRNLKLIGLAVFVVSVGLTISAVGYWIFSDDSADGEIEARFDDLEVPFEAPESWSESEATKELFVEIWQGPLWETRAGGQFLVGPSLPEGSPAVQWRHQSVKGWKALIGYANDEYFEFHATVWSAPKMPMLIIDLEARLVGPALASPLAVTTAHPVVGGHLLTDRLETISLAESIDDLPIIAAHLNSEHQSHAIHSVGAARGRATSTRQGLAIDWTLWPGLADVPDCDALDALDALDDSADASTASATTSARLILQFGDEPVVAAAPVPGDGRSLGTPIFRDAPSIQGDPWQDGSARDADDLARRLRALAFGHSDRDDPRYGNGGLLAAQMGAVFAIPQQWWDDAPIAELRQSLRNTSIEMRPHSPEPESAHQALRERLCADDAAPAATNADENANLDGQPPILVPTDDDQPFETGVAGSLPQMMAVGQADRARRPLLRTLLGQSPRGGLFGAGRHRALVIPVVATRNPLEPIADEAILSPDRRGHWTLHDSLTRQFSRWEMSRETDRSTQALSLRAIHQFRQDQSRLIPHFEPTGELRMAGDQAGPLYIFNPNADESDDAPAFQFVAPSALPEFTGPSPQAVDIVFTP